MDVISVMDIVCSTSTDGVGLRNSLYTAGCFFMCPGCHNKESWNYYNGKLMTVEDVFSKLTFDDCDISILGGEPFYQYVEILELCKLIKKRTSKTIWLYTGFSFETVTHMFPDILPYVDVMVDGKFDQELAKKHPNPLFRGSINQRIIDIDYYTKTNIIREPEYLQSIGL